MPKTGQTQSAASSPKKEEIAKEMGTQIDFGEDDISKMSPASKRGKGSGAKYSDSPNSGG